MTTPSTFKLHTIQFHGWDHKEATVVDIPIKKVLVTTDTDEEAKSQGETLALALSLLVNDAMKSKSGCRFQVFPFARHQ